MKNSQQYFLCFRQSSAYFCWDWRFGSFSVRRFVKEQKATLCEKSFFKVWMPIIKDTRDHVNLASRVLYELEVIYTELSSAYRLNGIFSEALCFSVFSQWTSSGCSMPSTVTFSCFILSIRSVLSATPCILHLFSGLRPFPLKNIPAQKLINDRCDRDCKRHSPDAKSFSANSDAKQGSHTGQSNVSANHFGICFL